MLGHFLFFESYLISSMFKLEQNRLVPIVDCLVQITVELRVSIPDRGGARNFPTEGLELPTGGGG